jgi:hypothetical protein
LRSNQARATEDQGVGEAMWTFQHSALTWRRTFSTGAYRLDVALARGPDGLTCVASEAFTHPGGGITMNSSIDGRPMTVLRTRQVSASCRVARVKGR